MRDLKKTLSVTLSLLLCFTALYAGFTIPVSAVTGKSVNSIINGDFSTNTLFGYDVSENVSNDDAISVNDEVCYIPERTDASSDGAYNRWINQKITLQNGKYIFSFDLDMTFSSSTAYAFAYSIKPGTAFDVDLKKPSNTNGTNYTLSKPVVSTISSLNAGSEIASVPVDSSKFAKSTTTGLWNYSGTANTRYVGRVSVVVDLNNTASSTTDLLFSIGCYAAGVSAYVDNISVEKVNAFNGDFSNGLTGYDISANRTHNDAMTVTNGVCYIPAVTSTVANDKPYNRWLNQKVILENGKYIFSYDLDITYTSANAYAFAHAVRNADNMDANIIRPTSGSANTGFTVGNATVETLDYVLNTNDATNAAPLTNFGLSNSSKYYNYNGAAGRQVGRVSFLVTVNNTSADTTALYFSIGNYGTVCSAYIDNISVEKVNVINGDFSDGLTGYDISARQNESNAEISVENGVCYIPVLNASSAYNRWVNQKVVLENGKYAFSFDLDVTFASNNAYAFAYAVRTETDMELGYMRPKNMSSAALTGEFTVSNTVISALDYVLNTADATTPASLTNFALSNSSKYYNYNGAAGRQVGRVSFVVEVNNTASRTTELYFSIGCYAAGVSAYIDNITLKKFDSGDMIQNGAFEAGETGYLNADDENLTVHVYDDADTTRPGYGEVELDGKAAYLLGNGGGVAYAKNNHLQYKIENLPAGKYAVSMDVLLNQSDTEGWTMLFGVTDAFDITNGRAYSKDIISYSPQVTEDGTVIGAGTSQKCHYMTGVALSEGWHNLDISLCFTITETTTVYFFVFCNGDGTAENMCATAYVDNIVLYEPSTVTCSHLNVRGASMDGKVTTTEYLKVGSSVSKEFFEIPNYNLMGYKINGSDEIINGNSYVTVAYEDIDISFVYALIGDLDDSLSVNALDLIKLCRYMIYDDTGYNGIAARINHDDIVDVRDFVALKKMIMEQG